MWQITINSKQNEDIFKLVNSVAMVFFDTSYFELLLSWQTFGSFLVMKCFKNWSFQKLSQNFANCCIKFRIFWEGHKIWKNLPLKNLMRLSTVKFYVEDFIYFCGLLRISKLYLDISSGRLTNHVGQQYDTYLTCKECNTYDFYYIFTSSLQI